MLSVYTSVPKSWIICASFSINKIAASLTCLCGIKKRNAKVMRKTQVFPVFVIKVSHLDTLA